MEKEPPKERISIFIDGSNLYHNSKNLKIQHKIDFQKLINELVKNRELIEVLYYITPLNININEKIYWKQQKFLGVLRKIPKFKVILCKLKTVKIEKGVTFVSKGDGVHLATDLVSGAYENIYDTAIIVSGDEDFVPAVKKVQSLNKKVENAYFIGSSSSELKNTCDNSICINKIVYKILKNKNCPALPEDHTGEHINKTNKK